MEETRRNLFDKAALNIVSHLESIQEVISIEFSSNPGVLSHEPVIFQKKYGVVLPEDMKLFYLSFNGTSVRWHGEIHGKVTPIGHICLSRLDEIVPIPIELDVYSQVAKKSPDPTAQAFVIDSHCEVGFVVILLFPPPKGSTAAPLDKSPEVWMLDLSGRWHYICNSFSQYFRLMIVHLGIFGWQYLYTPEGLPRSTIQWMNLFCKERLCADLHYKSIDSKS